MKFNPYSYQNHAIEHIVKNDAAGLFLDMGMGKTVSTLSAIDILKFEYFEVNKILIIAPLRVAESTWVDEIEKWDHLKHLRISKVLGKPKDRVKAINIDADIYTTNRENVEWLVKQYQHKWPFDMVVIDELSSFKSSKSVRFRALKKVRPYFKRIVGLTGTPAPNSLIDLWSQIYLLDGGKRLGRTITGYRDQYFNPGRRNQHIVYNWELKEGAEDLIQNKISDICISMMSKDYLEVPEEINNPVYITLNDEAKKKYKKLEKELVLELGEDDITATNSAVLSNKLLQMSNGAIYSENKEVVEIHEEKLKALYEIIEASNGKPILIFYNFKHDFDRILNFLADKKLKAIGLDGPKDIKKWNSGEIPILLIHPASAGHGLNLQYGGNIIVWFGLNWSLELYQQANARLHRQGQTERVVMHHLIAKDTIDEDVIKSLDNKEVGQSMLLEAVKARLEKYKS